MGSMVRNEFSSYQMHIARRRSDLHYGVTVELPIWERGGPGTAVA